MFSAVIVGVVDMAVSTARAQIERRRTSVRSYEQVEWARVERIRAATHTATGWKMCVR